VVTLSPSGKFRDPVMMPVTVSPAFLRQDFKVGTPGGAFVTLDCDGLTGRLLDVSSFFSTPPPNPNRLIVPCDGACEILPKAAFLRFSRSASCFFVSASVCPKSEMVGLALALALDFGDVVF
jgi:hypothetical protein